MYTLTATAALAALGADILQVTTTAYKPAKNVPRYRGIRSVALTGSAAAGDTAVELRIQGKPIMTIYNSATGTPGDNRQLFPVGKIIPPGMDFEAIVVDAALTNPIYLVLDMDE